MYLWKMFFNGDERRFSYTEHTLEKEKMVRMSDDDFDTDKSYNPDDPEIKDIMESAIKLCEKLELDFKDFFVSICKGFKTLSIVWTCGVFVVCLKDGKVKATTQNGWSFTREQFDALFDFVDVLIEHNWFF